ncbi:hypothetical protein BSKO_05472 [Bryopsis sp. KO-2023]|nr:hypothetical protein BSKO_05472 [Bryopsis sp. KO-2023]
MRLLLVALAGILCALSADADPCTSNKDCYPPFDDRFFPQGSQIPSFFVQCVGGRCACNGACFRRNNESNACHLDNPHCMHYDVKTLTCHDTRKSQTTAFFMSILLGFFGAANFYIRRLSMAIPQLVLLILSICGGGIAKLLSGGDQDYAQQKRNLCLMLVSSMAPFVLLVWWFADLIIFALGDRKDEHGCPLIPDL